MGHVVDYYKSLEKVFSNTLIIKNKFFKELTSEIPFSWNLIDRIITEAGGIDVDIFEKEIGDFAKDSINRGEYFAESFALYNMNLYTNLSNRVIQGMFHTLEGL